jgi:hypothetical protein
MVAKAINIIKEEHTEFLTCVILHMLVPLLPLLIETWKTSGSASSSTLTITASMYAISIGLSSRNKAIFSFCLFISILLSMAFGITMNSTGASVPGLKVMSVITIFLVFLIHACERYNKHVVECVPFWNFEIKAANS